MSSMKEVTAEVSGPKEKKKFTTTAILITPDASIDPCKCQPTRQVKATENTFASLVNRFFFLMSDAELDPAQMGPMSAIHSRIACLSLTVVGSTKVI